MTNRRNFQRVQFATASRLEIGEKTITCDLLDISLQGALLHIEESLPLEQGQQCSLHIDLDASDISLNFEVQLVHNKGAEHGFKFIEQDIDTITHLRRLLELNIGNDEEIDREISILTGASPPLETL